MATVYWTGSAEPVAQVVTLTVGGTIETTDIFKVTIGDKTVEVVGGSATAATVATEIYETLSALDSTLYPEFAEIEWADGSGGTLTATAKTAGKPFTLTLATTETGGGAADSQTFTQAATVANSGPNCADAVDNWSGGALPGAGDTVIIEHSAVDILYGLDGVTAALAAVKIKKSYTGSIGLPPWNTAGYWEYRKQYLELDSDAIVIGEGTGRGSPRIKIDTEATQTALTLYDTATPSGNAVKSVIWKGTHASNTVTVLKGSLDVAPYAGETAVIATLTLGYLSNRDSDADVRCSSGVTLGVVTKSGGALDIDSATTTSLTQTGGTAVIRSGAQPIVTIDGGTVDYRSSGTITTLTVGNHGTIDYSKSLTTRTVTNTSLYAGGTIKDPHKTVTWTNGVDLQRCGLDAVKIDLGEHWTLTPSAI